MVIQHVTRPFNPSFMHPAVATNKDAAAAGYMSCDSKTASFLVNCVSGLPSELDGSKCQLTK